ncbi:MAG: hypothetical protein IKA84_03080 [Clostridia bacterium]|nr:hypothetical protein [Clostridia bacterium]
MKRFLSLILILIVCTMAFIACDKTDKTTTTAPVNYNVNGAVDYLVKVQYKGWLTDNTISADTTLVGQIMYQMEAYTVDWASDTESVIVTENADGSYNLDLPTMGAEAVSYTLTATVTAPNGEFMTHDFALVVPKLELNTHEEYMAAAKGDKLQVAGVVVAINSTSAGNKYNHLFLADLEGKGGYYCYKLVEDPATLGIKVGMTVMVVGEMSPYNGMQEIFGGEAIILDETIKTVDLVDITEQFTAGANLGAYVGLAVTIKGVTVGSQDLTAETSQYLYFSIGEQQGYVRTYVTDFPAGMLAASDKEAIDADHAAHFGYKADVTGILVLYSGAPYLIPMSVTPFTNYEEVTYTDADKVASEKESIKISTSFSADAVINLPLVGTNYDDVTISWVSDKEAIVIAEDGTATITVPDEKTVVKLTATITCGDVTDTKEIEVTLNKTPLTAGQAIEIGAAKEHNTYTEGKYLIAGVIVEVYNTQYGNMKITDEHGNILTVYGSYSADGSTRYDAMESKPVVGDYVVLLGILGQYNGTPQTKNAWILSWTSPTSIPDANTIGTNNPGYTTDKYLVTGVVTEIANTKYGNLYIKDAEGNTLYLYGLYDQLGNRYDAMTTAPAVGDTITVLTVLGAYNDAPQGKNATLVAHTVATVDHECADADGDYICDNEECDLVVAPAADSVLTIEQANALGVLTTTADKYYVTGVITEVYNDQYGNMYITDSEGNTITVYGTYSADGQTRYDAMETKPVAGDTITVYGIITSYNGTAQLKNAWITAHTPAVTE